MIEELARHRCVGDDGTALLVIEYRHVFTTQGDLGVRRHLGATKLTLSDGEPVRYIDPSTFEIVATGELITHDEASCRDRGHLRAGTPDPKPAGEFDHREATETPGMPSSRVD